MQITDIYQKTTVADLDSDPSAPMDPYALALVVFVALQIVIVAAVLIRRVLKDDGHNSN